MKIQVSDLFKLLKSAQILHAPALPSDERGIYADMALITPSDSIRFIGRAVDVGDKEETFYLDIVEFNSGEYWLDQQGNSSWPPSEDLEKWTATDIALDMKGAGMETFLAGDRDLSFYRDKRALRIGSRGPLHSAAAIKLAVKEQQICIYATPEFPCSLEVVLEPSRIAVILAGLEEFDPAGNRI